MRRPSGRFGGVGRLQPLIRLRLNRKNKTCTFAASVHGMGDTMDLLFFLAALVVGAADPMLWIAPVITAFFSRRRPALILLAALLWGGVLEFALRPQLMPGYQYEEWFVHLASALLNGLVVLGVASVIWKMRKPRTEAAAEPSAPTQN
jgi:hypothetical protein